MSIRLSIIICTLNREEVLCDTLRAVLALVDKRNDTELLVIDQTRQHNEATDSYLAQIADRLHLQRVDFASLTRARNHGIRHASGEIVLFLDDDVLPSERLLEAHLECYKEHEVAGVGGCTLLPGCKKLSKSNLPSQELHRIESGKSYRFDLDWPRDISWAPGCNMSFRREWLYRVGGFDEAFYGAAIGEEAELCHRIIKAGGRIRYAPEAELVHLVNPNGGCRDATALAQRLSQVLDNSWYYWSRRGASLPAKLWQAWLILRPALISRDALRKGDWNKRFAACFKAVACLMASSARTPAHGLRLPPFQSHKFRQDKRV